jgi:putative PIN family toxin of toxin-antitoxin system
MTICLDTNVLVEGRRPGHRYYPVMEALVHGRICWAISNPILTEYEEIVSRHCGRHEWLRLLRLIELTASISGSIMRIEPSYQFQVISADPDDNAFTDCAITAHADYIITSDHHFAPLANAGYKPQPITPEAFIERYRGVHV